jgi:hypothetical protein
MLHRVALVREDVSEEHIASIIGVTRIGELGTTLAVTSNRNTLRKSTIITCPVQLHGMVLDAKDNSPYPLSESK